MKDPKKITTIKRSPGDDGSHPLKIVTGRENCAIIRMERDAAQNLLTSLEHEKKVQRIRNTFTIYKGWYRVYQNFVPRW